MSGHGKLVAFANAILRDATSVEEYLDAQKLPQPSFDVTAPGRLNIGAGEAAEAYERLLHTSRELHHLALGPVQSLVSLVSVSEHSLINEIEPLLMPAQSSKIRSRYPSSTSSTFRSSFPSMGQPRSKTCPTRPAYPSQTYGTSFAWLRRATSSLSPVQVSWHIPRLPNTCAKTLLPEA